MPHARWMIGLPLYSAQLHADQIDVLDESPADTARLSYLSASTRTVILSPELSRHPHYCNIGSSSSEGLYKTSGRFEADLKTPTKENLSLTGHHLT